MLLAAILVAGCSTGAVPEAPTDSPPPTPEVTPSSRDATPTPSPSATPGDPPQLFGTWRSTLGGEPLTLTITEDEYRIRRGSNQAFGNVRVDGDRIELFNSSLCSGTGEYGWTIEGGTLTFRTLEEPCPGRREALVPIRYRDYTPPSSPNDG